MKRIYTSKLDEFKNIIDEKKDLDILEKIIN